MARTWTLAEKIKEQHRLLHHKSAKRLIWHDAGSASDALVPCGRVDVGWPGLGQGFFMTTHHACRAHACAPIVGIG